MIRFQENYSLKKYNTFGIDSKAQYYFEFTESEELVEFIKSNDSFADIPKLILGGGSNYLFVSNFEGLILHPNIPGVRVLGEDDNNVWLEAGAGVIWDDFVEHCVNEGWHGVENLSGIPGNIGATPVQNIGAYGADASQVVDMVNIVRLDNGEREQISNDECEFGYRNSVFKNRLKGEVVVTSVVFKLFKNADFNLEYGSVKAEVDTLGDMTLANIRKAILSIRDSKLPAPEVIGNGGSFFMNPVVDKEVYNKLKAQYTDMPAYELDNNRVKLAAGWLIDQCGWKGYREGDAGVHDKQALVLVNHGNATGGEVLAIARKIQDSIDKRFGIKLKPEVIIIE